MPLLYHYTSIDSVIPILQSRSIFATDIHFLNDKKELQAGLHSIFEYVNNVEMPKKFTQEVCEAIRGQLRTIAETIKKNLELRDLFITSFTDKSDSLRQWMSYTKPNCGYAIGFDGAALIDMKASGLNLKEHYVSRLEEVAYTATHTDILHHLNPEKVRSIALLSESDRNVKALELISDLMFAACSTKPPEFSDESETRLILQLGKHSCHSNDTEFRNWGGVAAPYIKYCFPKEAIKSITIGPTSNMDLAKIGLRRLLDRHEMRDCEIVESACSLRLL
ncbi:DUF2971 domain-containing protein [Chromobacterium haemolyticum]|uniref:DUF2971 domain-containing protein n=1 Tax=Chromobacterium TaxID=535 RepID=UPI00405724AE